MLFVVSTCLYSTIINIPADQPTIQAGIDAAVDADTVLVQPGTYVENINYNGKLITVASLFLTTQDTTYISQTIIDGNENGSVVTFEDGEDPSTLLTGFTITNGSGGNPGGGISCSNSNPSLKYITISYNWASHGGGIYCINSSPCLGNITITGNTASNWGGPGYGGGIYCSNNSNPSLENITISDNSAVSTGGTYGGGICCLDSNPSLDNVTISGNWGGGIQFINSSPSLQNVTISGNLSEGSGAGISCINSNPSLVNITVSDNTSYYTNGGGIYCYESNPSLENVTITGNSADYGGGIYCNNNSSPNFVNCVLWNDSPQEIYFYEENTPNTITISYSDVQGGEAGIVTNNNGTVNWLEGNIDEDPLFVGTGDHPYSLQDLSPCVNAGIPDTTGMNLPEYDLAGNPRIYGGRIDMGAYENQNVVNANENLIPMVTRLNQNYPNPFNPTTTINYSLKENSKVSLNIYNIKGQKVKQLVSEQLSAGQHSVIWNGKDSNDKSVSSGIYFYKLETENYEKTKRMILMK